MNSFWAHTEIVIAEGDIKGDIKAEKYVDRLYTNWLVANNKPINFAPRPTTNIHKRFTTDSSWTSYSDKTTTYSSSVLHEFEQPLMTIGFSSNAVAYIEPWLSLEKKIHIAYFDTVPIFPIFLLDHLLFYKENGTNRQIFYRKCKMCSEILLLLKNAVTMFERSGAYIVFKRQKWNRIYSCRFQFKFWKTCIFAPKAITRTLSLNHV